MVKKLQKHGDRITITLRRDLWQTLSKIKIDKSLRNFNDVIELLFKRARIK